MSIDFPGGPSISSSVRPVTGGKKPEDEGAIIVHFTVVSEDPEERLAVNRVLRAQCQQAMVGNRAIVPIITDENTTMETTTAKTLAMLIAPWVMQILSIPNTGKKIG